MLIGFNHQSDKCFQILAHSMSVFSPNLASLFAKQNKTQLNEHSMETEIRCLPRIFQPSFLLFCKDQGYVQHSLKILLCYALKTAELQECCAHLLLAAVIKVIVYADSQLELNTADPHPSLGFSFFPPFAQGY